MINRHQRFVFQWFITFQTYQTSSVQMSVNYEEIKNLMIEVCVVSGLCSQEAARLGFFFDKENVWRRGV